MGQVNQRIDAWLNPNDADNDKNKADPFDVTNPLTPNGIFPPEVVELILKYLGVDPKSLFSTAISCKLWLQTGGLFVKGFRRYKLDPNTANLRNEVFRQQTIENNIKNGIYWANVLAKPYWVHRSTTMFNFDWSIWKNLIAINEEKSIRMSMGPEYLFTRGKIIDLGSGRQEDDADWGVHVVGGVQVVLNRSNWGFDWSRFTCYIDRKRSANIVNINAVSNINIPRDMNDSYHALRVPSRIIAGLHNLDESPTVLLYDRVYAQVVSFALSKENDTANSFSVECYDLLTGQMLHEMKINQLGSVIGYFKHYVICSSPTETVFVDLRSKNISTKFPVGSVTEDTFCICDRKIAFANGTLVLLYDWSTGRQIRKLNVGGLFDESKYKEQKRPMKIQGIAFDRWKLVLGIGADLSATREDYFLRFREGDSVPTFLAIFDMHDDFKLLQSIHVPSTFRGNCPFKIALPPKGSIVVENKALIEFDFNHPYLAKQIPVAFFNAKDLALQVHKVDPKQLSEFVQKKLGCDLPMVQNVTYFERDPHIEHKSRQRSKMLLEHSKNPSNWKSVRITFLSSNKSNPDSVAFTELGEFKKYYEKLPDVVSVFAITSKIPGTTADPQVCNRPKSVQGKCVLIFERFNDETGQWDIIEPFAPKGINFSTHDAEAGI